MPHRLAALLFFVAAGAVSFAAQGLLLRECLVLYRGSELAAGVFFAAWLGWIAVGAALGRRLARREQARARAFAVVALLYAVAPALQLLAMAGSRALLGVAAWQLPPLGPLLTLTALANAPVSLLTGLLFPLATTQLAPPERSETRATGSAWVTRTYLWEVLGSAAGGLALTALLAGGLSSVRLLLLLLAIWCAALALHGRLLRRRGVALFAGVLAVPAIVLSSAPSGWGLASLEGLFSAIACMRPSLRPS